MSNIFTNKTNMFFEYSSVLSFILVSVLLCLIFSAVIAVVVTEQPQPELTNKSIYECGFSQLEVNPTIDYLPLIKVLLLYVVFELELVVLIPCLYAVKPLTAGCLAVQGVLTVYAFVLLIAVAVYLEILGGLVELNSLSNGKYA